ncbi:hypothetical protein RvVAR031_36150 [Agrobacterium vitis]|nr:hypothetical protein RvVAR031_36150 [Agrobacterium vitis]
MDGNRNRIMVYGEMDMETSQLQAVATTAHAREEHDGHTVIEGE